MDNFHQKGAIFIRTEKDSMDGKVGQRGHIDRLQSAEDLDDLGYILKTIWNQFYDNMNNKFCLNFEIVDQNRDVIDHFKPNFDFFRH